MHFILKLQKSLYPAFKCLNLLESVKRNIYIVTDLQHFFVGPSNMYVGPP